MTGLGFKPQFVRPIIDRSKTTTIRAWRKDGRLPAAGTPLHFFTGMRTPKCQQFGKAVAQNVYKLGISWPDDAVIVWVNGPAKPAQQLAQEQLDTVAVADGFENWPQLKSFFLAVHGDGPFVGYLTRWEDTFQEVRSAPSRMRKKWSDDHVISMWLDHSKKPSESVGTCPCGWEYRVVWGDRKNPTYYEMDAACEAHWAEVDSR